MNPVILSCDEPGHVMDDVTSPARRVDDLNLNECGPKVAAAQSDPQSCASMKYAAAAAPLEEFSAER